MTVLEPDSLSAVLCEAGERDMHAAPDALR